jgi:transcriptional regulator with XRE-family HTH domain
MEDLKIIKRIKEYIEDNYISLNKLAKASGISYHRLWCILNQSYTIKLSDYIAICSALKEPFDLFITK